MLHPKALADRGLEDLRTTISTWKTRNAKEHTKIWRREFESDTRWRSMPKWNAISRSIKCYPAMHFKTIASNWNDSKEGKLAATWFDRKSNRTSKIMCEILLKRYKRKSFLHGIVTGDEKWIHYDNPKR